MNTRILAAAFVSALLAVAPLPALALDRLVTVSGEATISVAPDMVLIRIGVTTQGKTAREASEANAKQMTAVLAAIKQSGVADRDIQTSRLSLQPQYDSSKPGNARLIGFQVTNQITMRVHEIAKLPDILDHAIGAGANEMSGIEFVVSNQSKLLDQAREEAVADARRKAELYAKAAGAKVGQVVTISEHGAPIAYLAAAPTFRAGAAAMPVAPGEQSLQATVTVTYELAP